MIHLVKEKKGFAVKTVSKNGELLSTSETLKTKQSAIKNMKAQGKEFESDVFFFQDDTLKKPVVKSIDSKGRIWSAMEKPVAPTPPSRNKIKQ